MAGPVQARVATGASGNPFTYTDKPAQKNAQGNPENWSKLPKDNVYRQEWDAFVKNVGPDAKGPRGREIVLNAIAIYHKDVMSAQTRGVEPRASAKVDAAREAVRQERASIFAPKTSAALAGLTARKGALTGLAQAGIKALTSNPALAQTPFGAALQTSLTNLQTQGAFLLGVGEGVFTGGKDMVVGLAKFVGKVAQYGADNSPIGFGMDGLRSLLPSGAQAWMKESAIIPSAERGAATTDKMIDTLGAVKDYIANRTPAEVGEDIKGFIETNWEGLKASHAAAAAKGPEAEARWWGNVTGRAVFEVASVVVPVTKLGLVGKLADGAADLVRLGGKVTDLGKLAEVTRGAITVAREAILETRLGAAARDKLQETLTALRKVETGSLPVAEQRALNEAKASLEDALEIRAPRDGTIGNPAAIAHGLGELSTRQVKILDQLPKDGTITTIARDAISPSDIAALTAKTGDEFAIFTNGSKRMVLRGNEGRIRIEPELLDQLKSEGWRWTAHTQPGMTTGHSIASAGDQQVLKALGQNQSMILNSKGDINIFTQTDISARMPSR
jgi:hypothetical protein